MAENNIFDGAEIFGKAAQAAAEKRYRQSDEGKAELAESMAWLETPEGRAAIEELLNDSPGG